MFTFGKQSEEKLSTTHPDLQRVLRRAIGVMDFSVLCGLRNEADQRRAVEQKYSKANYPNSKHNSSLRDDGTGDYEMSDAVDVAPYPIQWPNIQDQTTMEYVRRIGRFWMLAGVILSCAVVEGVKLKWGGNFKKFFDGPHFEREPNE